MAREQKARYDATIQQAEEQTKQSELLLGSSQRLFFLPALTVLVLCGGGVGW